MGCGSSSTVYAGNGVTPITPSAAGPSPKPKSAAIAMPPPQRPAGSAAPGVAPSMPQPATAPVVALPLPSPAPAGAEHVTSPVHMGAATLAHRESLKKLVVGGVKPNAALLVVTSPAGSERDAPSLLALPLAKSAGGNHSGGGGSKSGSPRTVARSLNSTDAAALLGGLASPSAMPMSVAATAHTTGVASGMLVPSAPPSTTAAGAALHPPGAPLQSQTLLSPQSMQLSATPMNLNAQSTVIGAPAGSLQPPVAVVDSLLSPGQPIAWSVQSTPMSRS